MPIKSKQLPFKMNIKIELPEDAILLRVDTKPDNKINLIYSCDECIDTTKEIKLFMTLATIKLMHSLHEDRVLISTFNFGAGEYALFKVRPFKELSR